MTIIYGIIGLSLIVLIHETGHMIAAKLSGVGVEAFSIGMGPVLLHKTIKGTDFRLSLIPLGGYCAMKGESAFQDAIDNNYDHIDAEKDSFYGVHPLKRAFIAFSGPFFNVLFTVLAFTIISMIGYEFFSSSNRIIIASDYYEDVISPASDAGLETGDIILSINGEKTELFTDISQFVSVHSDEDLSIKVDRNGEILTFTVHSLLDKSTGAGKIGITDWIDCIVSDVEYDSAAYKAGLTRNDMIISFDGKPAANLLSLQKLIGDAEGVHTICWLRDSVEHTSDIEINPDEGLGIYFSRQIHHTPVYSFFPAIWQGFKETLNMISVTIKSIGLLFKGIDLSQAVSGPARITQMLGETAQAGFEAGFTEGLISVLNFLSLISISLFIMNLLPIPVLDGGLILFALIEFFRKKQIKPRILYYIQFIGIGIIVLLFIFALFSDINYFINK